MLLRSITKHVKDQNWFAVALDFVIVVVGILIAFQITNWNESHKAAQKEAKILATLEADFSDLEVKLIERMQRSKRLRNECGALQKLARRDQKPKPEDNVEKLILSCMSTSWGLSPPASFIELMSSGNLSKISDQSVGKVLIEYGQANALWRNIDGQSPAQKSEESKFRQAIKPKLFNLENDDTTAPDFDFKNVFSFDWELMKQADVSIGTIVKMHFDQYQGHKRDLEAVRKILIELEN